MEPLISVLVPVYNVEAHLSKCLDSILAQTYKNLEIILVDDGSTDASGKICDDYAKRDERIRVIHTENRGVAAARNELIANAEGEYVAFVDSDDILLEYAISEMCERIIADGSDLVIGNYITQDGNKINYINGYTCLQDAVLDGQEALRLEGTDNALMACFWGKLYKKAIIKDIVIPPLLRGEDTWAFPVILSKCQRISLLSKTVYTYYQFSESLTHRQNDELRMAYVQAEVMVARFFLERGMVENASSFFTVGIHKAMNLNKIETARQLILTSFTREEQKMLRRKDVGTYIRWIALKNSHIYKVLMGVKRIRVSIFGR